VSDQPFIGYPNAPKPKKGPARLYQDTWLDDLIEGFLGKEQPGGSVLDEDRARRQRMNEIGQVAGITTDALSLPKAALGALGLGGMLVGAPPNLQEAAKRLMARGASNKNILDATGLVQVPNGNSFFPTFGKQINMMGSDINPEPLAKLGFGNARVGDVLSAPELFKHAPQLQDIPVKQLHPLAQMSGVSASYNPKSGIGLPRLSPTAPTRQLLDTHSSLIHELQHAVQAREGWQAGGNTEMFTLPSTQRAKDTLPIAEAHLAEAINTRLTQHGKSPLKFPLYVMEEAFEKAKNPSFAPKYSGTREAAEMLAEEKDLLREFFRVKRAAHRIYDRDLKAFDGYRNLAGEAQARAAETAFKTGRYDIPLLDHYDVPAAQLLFQDPTRALPRLK
jgi:hypothetical protein